jgi:hypothetical protein
VETGPASPYAYFANRDVLLEHELGEVYGEAVLIDAADGAWRSALASGFLNTIEALGTASSAITKRPAEDGSSNVRTRMYQRH